MAAELDKVAVLHCESYAPEEIGRALRRGFDLLDVKAISKKWGNLLLKPNLCLPTEYTNHLTTHPEIVRQTILILREICTGNIQIGDTAIGATYASRERDVWEKTGMNSIITELPVGKSNLNGDIQFIDVNIGADTFTLPISSDIFQNTIINIPKLKTHGYMLLSGCVKNMYGILAGDSKKLMHKLTREKETFAKLLVKIYTLSNCKLNIVDAVVGIEGDGPGILGEPRKVNLILMSTSGIALDHVLSKLINIKPEEVLTNALYDFTNDIALVGDDLESHIVTDYKLPTINSRTDRMIQHVIESKRSVIVFDVEKCTRCGDCARNCPQGAITIKSKCEINAEDCISCLVCVEGCPHGAVTAKRSTLFKKQVVE